MKSCWGEIKVATQRLKHRSGKQLQMYQDASLDASGWSPEALERLLDLAVRLPFEEAVSVANGFGMQTSGSALERLTAEYNEACHSAVASLLTANDETLGEEKGEGPGRLMVLQLDGVYTLGRPQQGACPGMEIKSLVLYPQAAPKERFMLADLVAAQDLLPRVTGLLRQAKVTANDTLVGLGDGAAWVENIFDHLAATKITDVYHACAYLDTVMQALGWDETTRTQHRCAWYKGDVAARDWLKEHLPSPELWLTWDEEQQTALRYLEKRLDSMDYPTFKAKSYPIGSGQIEGMNKAVIGHRMKRYALVA